MSKLLEKTAALEPSQNSNRPSRAAAPARTAPGRMFEFTNRINEAEDRAAAATAEAQETKSQLEEARRQLEALQQVGGTGGAVEVEISTLVEVPGRRRILSPTEYQELTANLAENELIYPIVYLPLPDGKREIVAGHNRVAIYRDVLGRTKILGIPFKGDRKQAELGATFSNLLAPSLPDFEKYRQFMRLQVEYGFTRSDVVKASGLSSSHVHRILAFEKLPEPARAIIARRPDRVGGHAAEEFAALAVNGNEQTVIKAIQSLIDDDSMTQKRALELAKPKKERAAPAPSRAINMGKRKLCDVSVRNGVIGLRFSAKENEATVQEWADKIEAFMRAQIEAESGD